MSGWPITHAQLQEATDGRARFHKWRILGFGKVYDARANCWRTPWEGDGKGFPDRAYFRAPWIVAVDFKTGTGRLEPAQKEWQACLEQFECVLTYVWRPGEWRDGTVEAVLRDPVAAGEAA